MNQYTQGQSQGQQQGPSRQHSGPKDEPLIDERVQPGQAEDPSRAEDATEVEDDQDRGGDVKRVRISRDDNGPAEGEGHAGRNSEDL